MNPGQQTPLASLFDADVVLRFGDPRRLGDADGLHAEELAAIERAVEKRRREYAAARRLAREAFEALGLGALPLVNRADRSPVWPEGVIGSLTHTDAFCAVVATRAPAYRALGIDAEGEQRLEPPLFERVLTSVELDGLSAFPDEERRRLATLMFSAKEAFYKCQFPLTGKFLGFHDVELRLDAPGRRFDVRVLVPMDALPPLRDFRGRFEWHEGHVVTAVTCRARF